MSFDRRERDGMIRAVALARFRGYAMDVTVLANDLTTAAVGHDAVHSILRTGDEVADSS
jgi:hypothetical protein